MLDDLVENLAASHRIEDLTIDDGSESDLNVFDFAEDISPDSSSDLNGFVQSTDEDGDDDYLDDD